MMRAHPVSQTTTATAALTATTVAVLTIIMAVILNPGISTAAQPAKCCEAHPTLEGTWPTFQGNASRRGVGDFDLVSLPYRHKWIFESTSHTWKYVEGTSVWSSGAATTRIGDKALIYIGSYDHNLYCLDANTGAIVWRYTTGNVISTAPAYANVEGKHIVYVASADRSFYALDALTGEKLWQYETYPWTYTAGDTHAGSPLVATIEGNTIMVGTMWNSDHRPLRTVQQGEVFTFSALTGRLIWKKKVSSSRVSSPSLLTVDGTPMTFVAAEEGVVHGLDSRTGQTMWTHISDGKILASPVVAQIEGMPAVVVANMFGMVRLLTARSGEEIWEYKAGHEIVSTPAFGCFGGFAVVIVGSNDRSVYAIDAKKGRRLWKFATGKYVAASPAVASIGKNQVVFISSQDNYLYGLNVADGRELMRFASGDMLWPYETRGSSIWSSASLLKISPEESLLLYPAYDGKLYAFSNLVRGEGNGRGAGADATLIEAAPPSPEFQFSDLFRNGITPGHVIPGLGLLLLLMGLTITVVSRKQQ